MKRPPFTYIIFILFILHTSCRLSEVSPGTQEWQVSEPNAQGSSVDLTLPEDIDSYSIQTWGQAIHGGAASTRSTDFLASNSGFVGYRFSAGDRQTQATVPAEERNFIGIDLELTSDFSGHLFVECKHPFDDTIRSSFWDVSDSIKVFCDDRMNGVLHIHEDHFYNPQNEHGECISTNPCETSVLIWSPATSWLGQFEAVSRLAERGDLDPTVGATIVKYW
jgi:hypothetical protein